MKLGIYNITKEESKNFIYYKGGEVAQSFFLDYEVEDELPREIGLYFPDTGVYRSVRQEKKHLYIRYDAWCIDTLAMEELEKVEIKKIVVFDSQNDLIFSVDYNKFKNNMQHIRHGEHGSQLTLSRRYWDLHDIWGNLIRLGE